MIISKKSHLSVIDYLFETKEVNDEITKLEVEKEATKEIVLQHLRDLGVFEILPGQHFELIRNQVIYWIKYSPEIVIEDRKLKYEVLKRRERDRRK